MIIIIILVKITIKTPIRCLQHQSARNGRLHPGSKTAATMCGYNVKMSMKESTTIVADIHCRYWKRDTPLKLLLSLPAV